MIVEIEDDGITDLLERKKCRKYKKLAKDNDFIDALESVYEKFRAAERAADLKYISSLHYEKLKGNLSGFSSVRIMNGRVERLIFKETDGGISVLWIEINEKHYGNKK